MEISVLPQEIVTAKITKIEMWVGFLYWAERNIHT